MVDPLGLDGQGRFLRMGTDGIRFPYRFDRAVSFSEPGRLELSYAVENRAPFPLHALWSMHPFFRVSPDTEIMLPQPRTVRVELSKSSRLGYFSRSTTGRSHRIATGML